ncbi:FtsB family cell division protein [Actinocorallia populi]|uniref:FtsB family cell division protein n=1 Tax=Actinocorallia populi TaxID=2079200 RepID=UPI000D094A4A|nr:septum formation initiator family protein [Actinocorallia populi]
MCAIALSLAYPVREYVAQRSEISRLQKREAAVRKDVRELTEKKASLGDPDYVKREARRRLHFCDPGEQCYVVLDGQGGTSEQEEETGPTRVPPWYETLWRSVEAADRQG